MTRPDWHWDGSVLASIRRVQGLTQTDLADRIGCSQSQVSQWERNDRDNPTASTLVALATALECTTDALLGLEVSHV